LQHLQPVASFGIPGQVLQPLLLLLLLPSGLLLYRRAQVGSRRWVQPTQLPLLLLLLLLRCRPP